jgi:hypothetical protein
MLSNYKIIRLKNVSCILQPNYIFLQNIFKILNHIKSLGVWIKY